MCGIWEGVRPRTWVVVRADSWPELIRSIPPAPIAPTWAALSDWTSVEVRSWKSAAGSSMICATDNSDICMGSDPAPSGLARPRAPRH